MHFTVFWIGRTLIWQELQYQIVRVMNRVLTTHNLEFALVVSLWVSETVRMKWIEADPIASEP